MPDQWVVIADVVGRYQDVEKPAKSLKDKAKSKVGGDKELENTSGVTIGLGRGGRRYEEMTAVGFQRRASKNPDVDFKTKLDEERAKAQQAADFLNELFANAGELQ